MAVLPAVAMAAVLLWRRTLQNNRRRNSRIQRLASEALTAVEGNTHARTLSNDWSHFVLEIISIEFYHLIRGNALILIK